MIESDMRGKLVALLRPLHAIAVENGGAHPGTPDINYVGGWIECKATTHWPARESSPVALDHPVTKGQRIFAMKRADAGGRTFFIVTIDGEWMLFDGPRGLTVLDRGQKGPRRKEEVGSRADLYRTALAHWKRMPTFKELLVFLRPEG